jgi:hypothetical protein
VLDLQGLTDDLCEKLGRSVAVDNQYIEVIAASAQIGEIDRIRSEAILNRRTEPDIVEYVKSLGIAQADRPVQVPPHPDLNTLARWCFPLRQAGRLLGFLWIINQPPLTDHEFNLATGYATEIASILARNIEQADTILRTSVQLTNDLLREGDRGALELAGRSGMLVTLGQATVWSMLPSAEKGTHTAVTTADLFALLADLLATTHPGSFVGAPIEDRLVLVARNAVDGRDHQPLLTATQLSCRRKHLRLRAVGGADMAEGLSPKEALERATFAATVARWDGHEEVRRWESLGAWTLVRGHPWSSELIRSISPSAHKLIQLTKADLWETLLIYFESGANIQATCQTLHIHRATLYYRLGRIKEIAGEEILNSGWEQASAQLALRVWNARQRAHFEGQLTPL